MKLPVSVARLNISIRRTVCCKLVQTLALIALSSVRDRELEREIRELRDANDSLRSANKMLTDENERINTRLTSSFLSCYPSILLFTRTGLQHLLHHERFDREERDIGEHQELTLLRTALVQLESCLPSILLNSSDVASISTQTPQVDIADAITAVENMARRRLVITDFPDVETYVEPEEEHAEVADGVEEKGIDDQVMLDVADARIREVGTSDAVQKSKATKKALPTPSPETFSTTSTAAFEDGTKPDYGTMGVSMSCCPKFRTNTLRSMGANSIASMVSRRRLRRKHAGNTSKRTRFKA